MKDDKESRRNTLKALVMGAPAIWAKPVVDGVVLPAHAATTDSGGDPSITCPAGCYSAGSASYFIANPTYGVINDAVLHEQSTTCNSLQTFQESVVIAMDLDDANRLLDEETGGQCSLSTEMFSMDGAPCVVFEFGCASI